MPLRPFVVSLAMACLLAACGGRSVNPACTRAACEDGVRIGVRSRSGRFDEGRYRLAVTVDGRTRHCEVRIPMDPGVEYGCDSDTLRLELAGALAPVAQQGIAGVQILGTPKEVALTVQRGDAAIGRLDAKPRYRPVAPNGAGCPRECAQAEVDELWLP